MSSFVISDQHANTFDENSGSGKQTKQWTERAKWDEKDLENALKMIKLKEMSQKKASERYGIPRTTLQRYLHEGIEVKQKLGLRLD
jgi:predicted DNA-binding protein (UPF0251 family)